MNRTGWVDPRVGRVTVAEMQSYLLRHGWRLQPYPGPELLVFAGPNDDGEPIVQVLPTSEQLSDYPMRVEDWIGALSVIEQRPAGEILAGPQANGVQRPPEGISTRAT